MSPAINLLKLASCPIYEQLRLEEALFRTDMSNWCLVNSGSTPAIVLGTSCLHNEVVAPSLPLIRRFSGGGTVVVDEETLFFTFILNRSDVPCDFLPKDITHWVGQLLAPAFFPSVLCVHDHDYCIENRKVGGTAQSFSKDRVVHHVSFLWSWQSSHMEQLALPLKQPSYRKGRSHEEFCAKLSHLFTSKETLIDAWTHQVQTAFSCRLTSPQEAQKFLHLPHRKSLQLLQA